MKNNFVAERTDLMLTTFCNLKCKLCGLGVPYIKNKQHFSVENLMKQLEKFFEIWDFTKRLNFVGGEVFVHPNLYEILQESLNFKNKIESFRITTNGTILPSDNFFEFFGNHKQFEFVISDYGPKISKNAKKIIERLNFYKINCRVDKYYGDNMYFGGWTDYGDGSFINSSEYELENKYRNCGCGGVRNKDFSDGKIFLYNGKLFLCAVQFKFFIVNNIIPKDDEWLDLFDDSIGIDERKKIAQNFYKKPLKTCSYCNSINSKTSKRFIPAEQMP